MLENNKLSTMDLFMPNAINSLRLATMGVKNYQNHFVIKYWLTKSISKFLFRFYKLTISPLLPNRCRFYPTCSHFAYLSFAYSNPFFALRATLYRLLRCQPFSKGGFDYPIIFTTICHLDSSLLDSSLASPKHINPIPRICVWFVPLKPHTKDSKKSQGFLLIPSLT